jgi:site-specific DNA-methyltransferase (adenine-specific)
MTEPRPYFSDGQVSLHFGDCLAVMASLPDESVDITVTSPPYNMGLQPGGNGRGMYRPGAGANNKGGRFAGGYGSHGDAMPYDDYCAWQRDVLAECWRVSRLGIFYNHRPRVEHGNLRMPLDFDFGLPVRQVIIWDRGTGIDVNLRNFCTRQEWIILLAKPAFQLASHSASGMGDVWRLGMETHVPGHPAPFPVSLPARCIEATGAQSVLDPFAGSGSTLIAARNAGIRGTGIENWGPYCELAVQRYRGERRGIRGGVQMTLGEAS